MAQHITRRRFLKAAGTAAVGAAASGLVSRAGGIPNVVTAQTPPDLLLYSRGGQDRWLHSTDDGATWFPVVGANTPPVAGFVANGLTILIDGTWSLMGNSISSDTHLFYTSPNGGATWSGAAGSPDVFGTSPAWGVPDLTTQLLACADGRSLIVSSDVFATVTNVTLPNVLTFPSPAWGGIIRNPAGRFASIWRDANADNHAAYSDDGTTWVFTKNAYPGNGSGGSEDKAASLHYNPGAGAVVGASPGSTYSIIRDTDGSGAYSIVFHSANGPFQYAYMAQPIPPDASMAPNLALFVTGGLSVYAVTTTDGITWRDAGLTNLSFANSGLRFLYQTPSGAWLLSAAPPGGGTASLHRSTNGVNWTLITSAAGDVLEAMARLS